MIKEQIFLWSMFNLVVLMFFSLVTLFKRWRCSISVNHWLKQGKRFMNNEIRKNALQLEIEIPICIQRLHSSKMWKASCFHFFQIVQSVQFERLQFSYKTFKWLENLTTIDNKTRWFFVFLRSLLLDSCIIWIVVNQRCRHLEIFMSMRMRVVYLDFAPFAVT